MKNKPIKPVPNPGKTPPTALNKNAANGSMAKNDGYETSDDTDLKDKARPDLEKTSYKKSDPSSRSDSFDDDEDSFDEEE
jgi:hypothetical protein